jgi:serine/threonine-protein kinase
LQEIGFDPVVQMVYDPRYPAGVVVGQQPSSGTKVGPGTRVTVHVSGGSEVHVPDVLGLDTDSAKRQLAAAGLVAEVVLEPSCIGGASCEARLAAETGRVWRQDVTAGRLVKAGSVVKIAVGPRYTPAPSMPPPSASPSAKASPSPSPSGA